MLKKLLKLSKATYNSVSNFFTEQENASFIEMLTGFRGSLALSVVVSHSSLFKIEEENRLVLKVGGLYGVYGFFILSSFLLTYRIFLDFTKAIDDSFSQQLLITFKYFIRRFFRVYVPFVVYVAIVTFYDPKVGNKPEFKYESFSRIISLYYLGGWSGGNHLWTIAPEIKYYVFIPFFTLFMVKTRKFIWLFLIFSAILVHLIESHNLLNKEHGNEIKSGESLFKTRFTVFFKASIMAIGYAKIEKNVFFMKYVKATFYKVGFLTSCLLLFIYYRGLRDTKINPSVSPYRRTDVNFTSNYWTFFLLLLLVVGPNRFTGIFQTRFLKQYGKYSFGIYLLHAYAILLIKENFPNLCEFDRAFFNVLLAYVFGKGFYYLIEFPCLKFASFLCSLLHSNVVGDFRQKLKSSPYVNKMQYLLSISEQVHVA